jgi:hypothetical protein
MNPVVYTVVTIALVIALPVMIFGMFRSNEMDRYRELVSKPEHLLYKSASFAFVDRPNDQTSYVEVFGEKFTEESICATAKKDVAKLKKLGCSTMIDYFFDKRDPLSHEEFAQELEKYQKDLKQWLLKYQNKRNSEPKPTAPYDFSKITLLPTSKYSKVSSTFEW